MKIITAVIVLVIFGAGGLYIISNNSKNTTQKPTTSIPNETTNPNVTTDTTPVKVIVSPDIKPVVKPVTVPTVPTVKTYTAAEVAQHNSSSSCWSIVNSKVYNLTSWISQHPGGSGAILSMCGKDGSAGFNDQHSGQRRPANELAGFLLGDLK